MSLVNGTITSYTFSAPNVVTRFWIRQSRQHPVQKEREETMMRRMLSSSIKAIPTASDVIYVSTSRNVRHALSRSPMLRSMRWERNGIGSALSVR